MSIATVKSPRAPSSPPGGVTSTRLQSWRALALTTPGLLWTPVGVICLFSFVFFLAANNGVIQVRHASQVIGRDAAPSIVAAQKIAASLADMDANAANYLLGNANQNAQADQAFEKDSADVTDSLISAAQNITYGDEERVPIKTINANLHVYLEDVGAARTLHQKGSDAEALAAYRAATTLMAATILPAANQLDAANLKYLNQAYADQRQSSAGAVFLVVAAGLILIAILIITQVFLARRTHRLLNPGLLGATAIAVILTFVLTANLRAGDEHLRSAKQDAFDSVHALWQARAVANDANGDESRYLLDQAHAAAYEQAYHDKVNRLAALPPGQSYDQLVAIGTQDPNSLPPGFTGFLATELHNITYVGEKELAIETLRTFGRYVAIDGQMRALERAGRHKEAIDLNIGYNQDQSNWAFAKYDAALGGTLDLNEKEFARAIDESFATVAGFDVIALIAALAIAVLAFAGLYPRLNEYR